MRQVTSTVDDGMRTMCNADAQGSKGSRIGKRERVAQTGLCRFSANFKKENIRAPCGQCLTAFNCDLMQWSQGSENAAEVCAWPWQSEDLIKENKEPLGM